MSEQRPAPQLTVPEMLAEVSPGEDRTFLATTKSPRSASRFLKVTRNFNRDGARKIARLERDPVSGDHEFPSLGGIEGRRVSLYDVPKIAVTFFGNQKYVLDYYDCSGSIFFASEKLRSTIDKIDPGAIEFREVPISNPSEDCGKYYLAMPFREIWAVDTRYTQVRILSRELIPGHYLQHVFYGDHLVFMDDIPSEFHVVKDRADPGLFWSKELVIALSQAGIKGFSARDPSRQSSLNDVDL